VTGITLPPQAEYVAAHAFDDIRDRAAALASGDPAQAICASNGLYGWIAADYGKAYEIAETGHRDDGTPQACFGNAALIAAWSHGQYTYTEGYAESSLVPGWWIHHAWLTDTDGKAVEVTWRAPGRGYYGIEFDADDLDVVEEMEDEDGVAEWVIVSSMIRRIAEANGWNTRVFD
jgi:hypothetical protein